MSEATVHPSAMRLVLASWGRHLRDEAWRERVFLNALIIAMVCFVVWNLVAAAVTRESQEQIISSVRLLAEAGAVLALLRYGRGLPEWAIKAVILVATLNSVVVLVQILEEVKMIPSFLNAVRTDFWDLPPTAGSRKSGFVNGFPISSFLGICAIVFLIQRRDLKAVLLMAVNGFSIFFGLRTIFLFWPFILLFNRRALATSLLAFAFLFLVTPPAFFNLVQFHLQKRIFPAVEVAVTLNPARDYSAKDTMLSYRAPSKETSLVWGNGLPRYSRDGGLDPSASRWLFQAGFPALLLVVVISGMLVLKIALKEGVVHKLFACCLILLEVKTEIITSSIGFPILFLYAFLGAPRLLGWKEGWKVPLKDAFMRR